MGELNVSCDSSKNSTIRANIIHIERPYQGELTAIFKDGRVIRHNVSATLSEVVRTNNENFTALFNISETIFKP